MGSHHQILDQNQQYSQFHDLIRDTQYRSIPSQFLLDHIEPQYEAHAALVYFFLDWKYIFEAIQKEIIDGNNGTDSYFINFSDGEPYFENKDIQYHGHQAVKHTKTQIDNMRDRGIKVLSYFISGKYSSNIDNFKLMYGKDAENVNVTKLNQLTKSLNKRFATK